MQDLDAAVATALRACRESLATLEQAYAEAERAGRDADLVPLQGLVVAYSVLVRSLREYQESVAQRRPLPRRLAERLGTFLGSVRPGAAIASRLRLHPTLEEAEGLAETASNL